MDNKWTTLFSDYIHQLESADAAHDAAHVKRVATNAIKLAKIENAKIEIIEPAVWLHDCVTVAKDSHLRTKASLLSAEKAEQLLTDWQYPLHYIDDIKHAIAAHSYSANIFPKTLEAKIVQDADRLDSIGAIGIARMMMVGGKLDRALYQEDDPFCHARPEDDSIWTLDHFYAKLLKLNAGFHTKGAQDEAQRRHDYMIGFLHQLESEVS